MQDNPAQAVFDRITGFDGGDAGELGAEAQRREAGNGLRHAASLSMTKLADGLIDPKLVLSWLLTALGTPAALIGLLVPIREAGALLPQVVLAGWVQRLRLRKWAWVAGSAGQGISAGLIVLAALTLQGAAAGVAVCAALGLLALSRASCSVSYKDILGKTVGQSRRGAITGLAGSVSSVGVLIFAGLLVSGQFQSRGVVIAAIALAACLWLGAALLFSTLKESPSEDAGEDAGVRLSLLRENPVLVRFILVRGLLVSTALAPPYLVVLASSAGLASLGQLGALVVASAGASLVSSYVWGRLSDVSSRRVLMLSGAVGSVAMIGAVALALAGRAAEIWAMPLALSVLMVAYHGVRQGRSTYLVDMSPPDRRAAFAAIANTAIGTLLLAAGAVGGTAAVWGAEAALGTFAAMALAAAGLAATLPEAQDVPERD